MLVLLHVFFRLPRTERLEKYCDLSTAEMLGKGAYGFVTWSWWSGSAVWQLAWFSQILRVNPRWGDDMSGQGASGTTGQSLWCFQNFIFERRLNRSTNHETPVSFKRNAIIWCDKTLEISQVVKLQGPRWASVAAQEWAHGWNLSAACGLFVARSLPCPTRRLLQTWEHRCSFGGLLWERCKWSQKMEMYQMKADGI